MSTIEIITSKGIYKVVVCPKELEKMLFNYKFTVPSNLAVGLRHVAKAVEETLEAECRGEALRNIELEFYRRLLVKRQVKDVLAIVEKAKGSCREEYVVYVIKKDLQENFLDECGDCFFEWKEALKFILGEKAPPECFRKSIELLETFITSIVALTRIDRWL